MNSPITTYALASEERNRVFRSKIVPKMLDVSQPSEQPIISFVAGQPGSGKTSTTEKVLASHGETGAAVVDYDLLKTAHPAYEELSRTEQLNTTSYLREDTRQWWKDSIDWLIQNRRNIIIETTMAEPVFFHDPLQQAREHGYASELVVMAVPAPLSQLGIVQRYDQQRQASNSGRLTPAANYEIAYHTIAAGLAEVEDHKLVDVVMITTRAGGTEYINQLNQFGQWMTQPRAVAELTHLRDKQFSYEQATDALGSVEQLQQSLPAGDARDRLAQVRREVFKQSPPGVEALHHARRGASAGVNPARVLNLTAALTHGAKVKTPQFSNELGD